jgi:hypothetical protein
LHPTTKTFIKKMNKLCKNPTIHGLFWPMGNEICAHLQKTLLIFLEKKSWQKRCKRIMAFWAYGLTNVQPTSKKSYEQKSEFGPWKFDQSWFNRLVPRPTSKIGGPPNKSKKVGLITSPWDHEILFIMHLMLIFHSFTFSWSLGT